MEHMWQIKFGRAISIVEVPLRSEESSPQTRSPSPWFQGQEEKSPLLLLQNPVRIETEGVVGPRKFR